MWGWIFLIVCAIGVTVYNVVDRWYTYKERIAGVSVEETEEVEQQDD